MILGEHSTCPVGTIAFTKYGCNVILCFVEHIVVINCSKIHFVLSPDADVDLIYNLNTYDFMLEDDEGEDICLCQPAMLLK